MNIYVGNLPYTVRNQELRTVFEKHGAVDDAEVVIDRRTNRSRGYGFVRMKDANQARAAIKALNGFELHGRRLRVDESKPKPDDSREDRGAAKTGPRSARAASTPQPDVDTQPPGATGGLLGFIKRLFS
jgi:RNA recognition motif-containing protein